MNPEQLLNQVAQKITQTTPAGRGPMAVIARDKKISIVPISHTTTTDTILFPLQPGDFFVGLTTHRWNKLKNILTKAQAKGDLQ